MEILTETEIRVLTEARFVLSALAHGFDSRSIEERAKDQVEPSGWLRDSQLRDIGRVMGAAEVAESAVFDLLNVMGRLNDPLAARDIHQRREPLETPFGPVRAVESDTGA